MDDPHFLDADARQLALLARLAAMRRIGGFEWIPNDGDLLWSADGWRLHGIDGAAPATLDSLLGRYDLDTRRRFGEALERLLVDASDRETVEVVLLHAPEEQLHRLHLSLQREPRHGPLHRITGLFEHQGPDTRDGDEALVPQVDPLTGVANRAGLEIEATAALEAARRGGRSLALLFLDLDRFKPVNDTLGHQAGDELLRVVAERLLASVRGSDLVARQGGDEFIVVLSEVHRPQDAALVAQKIIDSVMRPISVGGQSVQVGCSIGIALLSESCPDFTSLMRAADTAMYAAKDAGRNTYRFYSDAFYLRIQRRVELEQELRRALQRDELFLVYQPTVRLEDGRTGNIEALMRWRSSDGSLRQPAEFVPLAEEIGEILPIGRWVVVEACRQAAAWITQGLPFERMAINVSGRQLRDPDFARHVLDACTGCGLSPSRLEIELAESSLLVDRDASRRTLGLLQAEGVTVSIDDFGAAFSNLIYLDRFQIKGIKLDRHFALGMQDDPALRDLTEAVIAMGHALRLRMVAKGVESEHAVRFLADHGCDEAQGFQYARPMPPADVPFWSSTREVARWAILAPPSGS